MEKAVCIACGDTFDRDYDWKKLCMACWLQSKNKEESSTEKLDRLKRALGKTDKDKEIESLKRVAVPNKEMVKRLLQLSHPDRHGNSQSSQIATAWLLEVSKEFKQ